MLRASLLAGAGVSALIAGFAFASGINPGAPTAAQLSAAAPVQSVNGQTGNPVIPAYQRQVSGAMAVSTADGTLTWAFPTAFTNPPTCFYSLTATSTSYTYDHPEVTAISRTSVSLLVTAHPKTVTIASVATLPILLQITPAGPPAGTTITFSCLAPL